MRGNDIDQTAWAGTHNVRNPSILPVALSVAACNRGANGFNERLAKKQLLINSAIDVDADFVLTVDLMVHGVSIAEFGLSLRDLGVSKTTVVIRNAFNGLPFVSAGDQEA